jgi:DNA-binding PadR family transcriptional regulator
MYELFVLGELMDQPMHGYRLQSLLKHVLGPVRKISWGVLYPLIRKLLKEGLIEQSELEDDGSGRAKKSYQITEEGKERFYWLMTEPSEYSSDFNDLFDIKLSNFHHIGPDEQSHILMQYREYLLYIQKHLEDQKRQTIETDNIPEGHRPNILHVLNHRMNQIETDIKWINEFIEDVLKN